MKAYFQAGRDKFYAFRLKELQNYRKLEIRKFA